MLKKQLIISFVILAFSAVASVSYAEEGASPGEGYYVGAFLGYGTGLAQAEVTTNTGGRGVASRGTFETDRGGLGFAGIQGGGWLGWGMKTADDLYFGAEVEALGSDEKVELTSSVPINFGGTTGNVTSLTAQRLWQAGGAVRVGYYINDTTLFALKGGVAISQVELEIGQFSESYYIGGPQMGVNLESKLSKIDPNLSLRLEFVHTRYLEIDGVNVGKFSSLNSGVAHGGGGDFKADLTGSDSAGRIGITYSF